MIDPVTIQTVNLNGSTKVDLVGAHLSTLARLGAAISAMAEIAPHGRDYQTQADNGYARARQAHLARVTKLRDIYAEIEEIALAIDAQG